MTTAPSPEYVAKLLQSADEAVSDAKYLLQDKRLKVAAKRAYYAMFYAVQAALIAAGVKKPKTHSGTMFHEQYVVTGKVDRDIYRYLQNTFDLRQKSDYEVYPPVGEPQVGQAVERAQAFVQEVKKVLGRERGPA